LLVYILLLGDHIEKEMQQLELVGKLNRLSEIKIHIMFFLCPLVYLQVQNQQQIKEMNYKISMPCIKKFCRGSSRSVTACQINMQAIVLFMELCYVFCSILVTLSSRFSQVLHLEN
jgi:hypothetical protein